MPRRGLLPAAACAALGAAAARGSGAWRYAVPPNPERGVASQVAMRGGSVVFSTDQCVVDYGSGSCVNTTGLLVALDPETGALQWDYRPGAGGVNGQLGFPRAPAAVGDAAEVVVSSHVDDAHAASGAFLYEYRRVPPAPLRCAVPLESGNRHRLLPDSAGEGACTAAGGCWQGKGRCALVPTAQTTDCPGGADLNETGCGDAGCCWDPAYSPGRCFAPSPACYRPGPAAEWTSSPSNLTWATDPATDGAVVAGVGCDDADCGLSCLPRGCGVQAFSAADGRRRWRRAVADKCSNITLQRDVATRVAIGGDGLYSITCAPSGTGPGTAGAGQGTVQLRAMAARDGKDLWSAQLGGSSDNPWKVASPTYDDGAVYAGAITGGVEGARLQLAAYDAATGKTRWEVSAGGYECTSLSSWGVPVVATAAYSRGRAVLYWGDFAVNAVDAATGKKLWDTSSLGVTVAGGVTTPSVQGDVVVFHGVKGTKGCEATYADSHRLYAVRVEDGTLAGSVAAPAEANPPCSTTQPVAAAGKWIFSYHSTPPQMTSTVFAVPAP